jgi:hypothetical protein
VIAHEFGIIDETGRVVIPPQFEYAGHFIDGLAQVQIGDRLAFIDPGGKVEFYLPAGCATEGWFSEGLALVNVGGEQDYHEIDGGRWGYINRQGDFAIPAHFFVPRTPYGTDRRNRPHARDPRDRDPGPAAGRRAVPIVPA